MGLFSSERTLRKALLECSSQALNSWEPLAEVNPTSCSCPAPRCHFCPLKRKVMKWLVTLISIVQRHKDRNSYTVLPSALPSSGPFSSSPCPLFICEPTAGHCPSCIPLTTPNKGFRPWAQQGDGVGGISTLPDPDPPVPCPVRVTCQAETLGVSLPGKGLACHWACPSEASLKLSSLRPLGPCTALQTCSRSATARQ